LEFGVPVLTTEISNITGNELWYRNQKSSELAKRFSFEQVAQYLWTGQAIKTGPDFDLPEALPYWENQDLFTRAGEFNASLTAVERLQAAVPSILQVDLRAHSLIPEALISSAANVILHLLFFSTGQYRNSSVAETLGAAWGADSRTLNQLLILVADHELNIAAFTARCIASAGSTIYQAVSGGLSSLQGYKHLFGQVAEASAFFREVVGSGDPAPIVRRYLRERGSIPGFHNPYRRIYASRDPRVANILNLCAGSAHYDILIETVDVCGSVTGEHPRVDFALGVVETLLDLPGGSIFDLIALGRTAGMIAHILEQYKSGRVIRPRARYESG